MKGNEKLFYGILIVFVIILGAGLFLYLSNFQIPTGTPLPTPTPTLPPPTPTLPPSEPEAQLSYKVSGCETQTEKEYSRVSGKEEVDFEINDGFIKLTHYLNYVCCADIKFYLDSIESQPDFTLVKLKEKNEGEMCKCICDYVVDAIVGPLEKGKYLIQIWGVEYEDIPSELLWEKEISIIKKSQEEVCKDLCGDGICQEVVCLAVGCPCPETPETCPQDCQ